jgi:aspartyl-tRNA synthetase
MRASPFFVGGKKDAAEKIAGVVRNRIAEELDLSEKGAFRFCRVTDFAMYELDEETKQLDFSHNPFADGRPAEVSPSRLKELSSRIDPPPKRA